MTEPMERFARQVPAGTVLFREGEPGEEMYVVSSGRVDLVRRIKDRETLVATVPPGEFFGEMAILNARPRSATAIVREDATLLIIDSRTFEAMIRGRAEIAVRMLKALARRLEQANRQIELLIVQDAGHRVVQLLRHMAEQRTPTAGGAVFIPITLQELALRVALEPRQVWDVVERLRQARLVVTPQEAGLEGEGFVLPEVGRLADFLEFLELKERFGGG